jgi:hypothetical protein
MGGFGSGSWYRFSTKNLVENCLCIDICKLNRDGMLSSHWMQSLSWSNGSNIALTSKPDSIELSYSVSRNGQKEDVNYTIPLSWTPCNYGGKRPWFICPGKSCNKRVANLYLRGKYFLCRHCHGLAYSSQRDSEESRLLHKSRKICRKLGAKTIEDLYITSKPKGMHQKTYDRLFSEATDLDLKASRAMMRKLEGLLQLTAHLDERIRIR